MNFRIQDLLKKVIPGITFTVLTTALCKDYLKYFELPKDLSNQNAILLLIFLTIVYVLGYFIDWFASFLESLFYKRVQRPSFYILNQSAGRYNLSNRDEITENICDHMHKASSDSFSDKDAKEVFDYANQLKDKNGSITIRERVTERYFSYIFSRNLMTSFIISFLSYLIIYLFNLCSNSIFNFYSLLTLILALFSFLRCRQNAFYYTRQVFYASSY